MEVSAVAAMHFTCHFMYMTYYMYRKRRNFRWGLIFVASIPTKIKPTKICKHTELATVIMAGYSYPQKLVLHQNLTHELL